MERQRRQRLANVELDDTLDHYIWNGIDTMQYKVILVDCVDIAKLFLKIVRPSYCRYPSWIQYPKHYL